MKTTIKEAYKASKKEKTLGWVTFKDIEEPKASQVWIIEEYDRSEREYMLYNWADTSKYKYVAGDKACFNQFYF